MHAEPRKWPPTSPPSFEMDGRRRDAKRYLTALAGLEAEMGRVPTVAEQMQLQSAAALALQRDGLLARAAAGHEIDALALASVAAELRQALAGLGLPMVRRVA